MVIVVQILGAIGGLMVLIAGVVGAIPFVRVQIPPGAELTNAQVTGVFKVLKCYLSWALILFAVGGLFVLIAFLYFIAIS